MGAFDLGSTEAFRKIFHTSCLDYKFFEKRIVICIHFSVSMSKRFFQGHSKCSLNATLTCYFRELWADMCLHMCSPQFHL